jgi:hypothetical protein
LKNGAYGAGTLAEFYPVRPIAVWSVTSVYAKLKVHSFARWGTETERLYSCFVLAVLKLI